MPRRPSRSWRRGCGVRRRDIRPRVNQKGFTWQDGERTIRFGRGIAAGRLGAAHFLQKPVDLDIIARIATAHGIPTSLRVAPRHAEVGPVD